MRTAMMSLTHRKYFSPREHLARGQGKKSLCRPHAPGLDAEEAGWFPSETAAPGLAKFHVLLSRWGGNWPGGIGQKLERTLDCDREIYRIEPLRICSACVKLRLDAPTVSTPVGAWVIARFTSMIRGG